MRTRLAILLALASLPLVAAACGEDENDPGGSAASSADRPVVVATTTQAADLARNVAGDRAEVTSLLAPNADPHAYELRPRDVEALAEASLIVRSGGDLDEWLEEAIESSGTDAEVVNLIDSVSTIEGGHGHEEEGEEHAGEGEGEEPADEQEGEEHADEEVDPHWWQDPRNAVRAVAAIEAGLAAADPGHDADYAANATRYSAEIEALDREVERCWSEVPRQQRKLVTAHDALGYYADRYELEVVGAVIPSLSTEGQASAGEVAELADTIRREKVRVVFAESSVNSKVEQAIARETGAEVGPPLWADTLGPEGSDGATYLASIASNTEALIEGLSGGAASCSPATG